MHVYAIESPQGLVKIGRSGNPDQRIGALSSAGGFEPVSVWYSAPLTDAAFVEKSAHAAMAGFRKMGEWFQVAFDDAVKAIVTVMQSADSDIPEDPATESFRRLLNSKMKAAGLTQAALGKASGISQRGISGLQSGSVSPTLRTLSCISEALNTPAALFVCSPEDARLFAAIERLATDQREALTLIAEQLADQP